MTKIYLVTSGSYSDYSVDAAFLTREKAQAFIKAHDEAESYGRDNHSSNYDIEVFEDGEEVFKKLYRVESKYHSIEVGKLSLMEYNENDCLHVVRNKVETNQAGHWTTKDTPATYYTTCVAADDVEHAVKIAADLFRQYKALVE